MCVCEIRAEGARGWTGWGARQASTYIAAARRTCKNQMEGTAVNLASQRRRETILFGFRDVTKNMDPAAFDGIWGSGEKVSSADPSDPVWLLCVCWKWPSPQSPAPLSLLLP